MIYDGYQDLMINKSDPRVNDWPMMSGPFSTLAICLFYAYFVKVLGPKMMENRKPFNLRKVMIWYNLFQVIFSTWLFKEVSCPASLFIQKQFIKIFYVFFHMRRVWSEAGEDDIPSGVNRLIIQTTRLHCERHEVAGGITSQSSWSSRTQFSLCWEKRTTTLPLSMSSITAACLCQFGSELNLPLVNICSFYLLFTKHNRLILIFFKFSSLCEILLLSI